MKIGKLANLTSVASSTIRYYDKLGLLGDIQRPNGGTRQFSDNAILRINIIKGLQNMGFSLAEMSLFFQLPKQQFDHQKVLDTITTRIAEMDKLMSQLQHQKSTMAKIQSTLTNTWANGDCLNQVQLVEISRQLG